jgi:GH25 family lysozyme M1 (1,4-beta-N-acetylmuramidase)
VLAAVLAFVLIRGNKKEESSATYEEDMVEEEELPEDDTEQEDEAEEEELVSTVKVMDTETDELTRGIDVSEYQGNIDWQKAAAEDLDFVMVRLGYRKSDTGEITEDQCARYNLQEAGAQGLYLGAYFVSTAVNEQEAREEARWVCDLLEGYPITYPVAYNCEGFQNESSRQYDLTADDRSRIAEAFLDEVEAQGYTGMFYASVSELKDNALWDTKVLEAKYRIWVAQYTSASQPDYDGKYAMWQHQNQGSVAGISGLVDMNVAYFGYSQAAEAKNAASATAVTADPEVGVRFTEVQEQVTAKDEVNLRSTMEQGDSSNVVAKLKNGDVAVRTGTGNNGWSRLEYQGQTLYAVSSYLTTDLSYVTPVEEASEFKTKFTKVSEQVTAKDVTNLRNRPSVEEPSQVIAQLHNGEVITRTGISEMGWSRVEYNGQTLYCISSYLQTAE